MLLGCTSEGVLVVVDVLVGVVNVSRVEVLARLSHGRRSVPGQGLDLAVDQQLKQEPLLVRVNLNRTRTRPRRAHALPPAKQTNRFSSCDRRH